MGSFHPKWPQDGPFARQIYTEIIDINLILVAASTGGGRDGMLSANWSCFIPFELHR